jgi:hypothetical protein
MRVANSLENLNYNFKQEAIILELGFYGVWIGFN